MVEWMNYIGALGLGAVLADIVRGLINWFMHKRQWSDEIKKTVILKKLQVVEDAMACLQSIVDELMQLKLICKVEHDVPANYLEWCRNLEEHTKVLYPEVKSKLNRLGTYYDFSAIEKKHDIYRVLEGFNQHVAELSIYSQHVHTLEGAAKPVRIISGGAGEIEPIMARLLDDVDAIIAYAEGVQTVIRKDIGQYCK
jgi:hypothetical protein